MIPDGAGHWMSKEITIFKSSERDITIVVPTGEVNDLASIPRLFRRVFSVNGPHRPAAALHDYLYGRGGQLPSVKLSRKECDDVFLEAMLSSKHDYYLAASNHEKYLLKNAGLDTAFVGNFETLVPKWKACLIYSAVRMGGWLAFND